MGCQYLMYPNSPMGLLSHTSSSSSISLAVTSRCVVCAHRRHEGMSCRLLELVLSEAQLDLDSQQLQHVQDSIDNGPHRPLRQPLEPDQIWRLQVCVGNWTVYACVCGWVGGG